MAFMEEADDDSNSSVGGRAGTRVYAYQVPDVPRTPNREIPNTGKSRRGDAPAGSSESRLAKKERDEARRAKDLRHYKEAREDERIRREERREMEARRARAAAKAAKDSSKALKKTRPQPVRHAATQPVIQQSGSYRRGQYDEPSHYGIPQPAASGNRPRASSRPASYYAGQNGPPPHHPNWQHGPMSSSPYPPPVGSYQPPMPMYGPPPPLGMHGGPPPPSPGGPPSGYFDMGPGPPQHPPRDLKQRFDRPSSAMDYRSPSQRNYQPDGYSEYDEELPYMPKRQSRANKQEEDRKRMPPPQFKPLRDTPRRPSTTTNTSSPFQPPPMRPESRQAHSRPSLQSQRRSVVFADEPTFDEDDLLDESDLFHDTPPHATTQRRRSVARPRRESPVYSDDEYELMPASVRSRRGSTFGPIALGSGGASLESESKYMDALRYQDDITGGPQMPLTAETLRKANKRGDRVPSSRSTRSSGSHDESEYKDRTNTTTTGITRSSTGGDDFTIKVSGNAVVRVGGAEIACQDSEITFSNGAGGSRGGSDHASTLYQLEGRGYHERKALPHRTRAPSQSDSQSRGYVPSHAPYDPPYGHYV